MFKKAKMINNLDYEIEVVILKTKELEIALKKLNQNQFKKKFVSSYLTQSNQVIFL